MVVQLSDVSCQSPVVMSGAEVQAATGGRWLGASAPAFCGVSTDSRTVAPGQAFVALRGERFDGHHFLSAAAERGAALLVVEAANDALTTPQLVVPDTLRALGDMAAAWRRQFSGRVVAISGTAGKTTLRSQIQQILTSLNYKVAATSGNLNNLIGAPLTLLQVSQDADFAIIECGISIPGEMARLAAMTAPDLAVLTTLGCGHAGGLGGESGVASEKAKLFDALPANGTAVTGLGVADKLQTLGLLPARQLVAAESNRAVQASLDGCRVTLCHAEEEAAFDLPLPAAHLATQAALAATVVRLLLPSVPLSAIASALNNWQPEAGRMAPKRGKNGALILDDAYNANPLSMQAALATLRALPGRRIAILGDMLELGADSQAQHCALDLAGVDELILIGPQMRYLWQQAGRGQSVANCDEALRLLPDLSLDSQSVVLIKASHGLRLDRLVSALTENNDAL